MTATDILIVEDDLEISGILCDFLRARGYIVTTAADGNRAMTLFERYGARLVILDMMLPGLDGLGVLSRIRRESNTPVLILSARTAREDKLDGLMAGADDYMEKPVDIDILMAKIDGIFKRHYAKSSLEVGDIRIDLEGKQVFLRDQAVETTAKEYELLLLLMQNRGKALNKDYLFRQIWGSDSESEFQTLTVHVKRLRSKLEEDPKNPQHIQTVWGVGYKFL